MPGTETGGMPGSVEGKYSAKIIVFHPVPQESMLPVTMDGRMDGTIRWVILFNPLKPNNSPTSLISVGMFLTALTTFKNMYHIMSRTRIMMHDSSRAILGFPIRLLSPSDMTGNRARMGTP